MHFGSTFRVLQAEPESPPPIYPERTAYVSAGDWLEPDGFIGSAVELPPDFAIREVREVDLLDGDALAEFATSWGLPRHGLMTDSTFRAIGGAHMVAALEIAYANGSAYPAGRLRVHLQVLRAIANVYLGRECSDADTVANAWVDHGFDLAIPTVTESQTLAALFMNDALAPFRLHVTFDEADAGAIGDFYSGAMLQLAQAMSPAGREVMHCHNVNCGRPFTRQRGRSRYPEHQHTRGVKYCSHRCAKAQSERERRAARDAGAQGLGK